MKTSQHSERESLTAAHLPTLLNEFDVASATGLSVASVLPWRLFGHGPTYLKIGASVRYRPEDVRAWLETRPTGGGVEAR